MKPLLVATNNPLKRAEISAILAPFGVLVVSPSDVGLSAEPEETGKSFAENAAIKARAFFSLYGGPVLADDSGLCVAALGGRPGIRSARYGGPEVATSAGQIRLLLREMKTVRNRSARFVCAVCCLIPNGTPGGVREIVTEGLCPGKILRVPRGTGGLGYDPVFYLPEYGLTMAELPAKEKNQISHRAAALRAFAGQWKV